MELTQRYLSNSWDLVGYVTPFFITLSHGTVEQIWSKYIAKGVEFGAYCWLWQNYSLYRLQNTILVNLIAFIGVDFAYYWFHRMAHEVNIFWASHSVHHSSEEYNFSAALRQSVLQLYVSWMFYLPLAFVIPPTGFYIHKQINVIYQFWIHTTLVDKLGPLEYILNTPSHHRVHHGRNPRYLDKNYGGIFIIFDRMFGTFLEEDEKPYYGLVHPLQTFDIWESQIGHLKYIINRIVYQETGIWNRLAVIWKGPGWNPGQPRLGDPADIPAIDPSAPVPVYNPTYPRWVNIYVLVQFISSVVIAMGISEHFNNFASRSVGTGPVFSGILDLVFCAYLVWAMVNFGLIFDKRRDAFVSELARLCFFFACDSICWAILANQGIQDIHFMWYRANMPIDKIFGNSYSNIPQVIVPVALLSLTHLLRFINAISIVWFLTQYAIFPTFVRAVEKVVDNAVKKAKSSSPAIMSLNRHGSSSTRRTHM